MNCTGCGINTDGLTTCYINGEVTENLCPDCMVKDGNYCLGCGNFCAGTESFDFSEIEGYCELCVDEINSNSAEDDNEDEEDSDDFDHPYLSE